jgi:integrase
MGRGGIRKRGSSYEINFYDRTGERYFETIGPNKKEAEQVLGDRLQEIRSGTFGVDTAKEMTFKSFLGIWDRDYAQVKVKEGRLKVSTYELYQGYIACYIKPFFGKLLLREVTSERIRKFKGRLLKKNLSPKSVNNILVFLKEVLNYAYREDYLDKDAGKYIERLPQKYEEPDFLSTEDIKLFLQQVKSKYYPFFLCAVMTGLRQGELLGLRWGDIDFSKNQIYVRRSYYRGTFVKPKSERSKRAVNIPPILTKALMGLTSSYLKDGIVFCDKGGTPYSYKTIEREFKQALRLAGLRRVKFHSLRHSYTALLIAQGEHSKYIQSQLGHASITTTMDIYGHIMPEVNREAPKKLEKTLFGETLLGMESVVSEISH